MKLSVADAEQDAHLREIQINSEIVYSGGFLQVQRDTVRLPDSKTATREFIRHPGAVVVLPMFDDGSVLLERQFRYPLKEIFVEFPAGKIDPGEDILTCAKRELEEETGYTATNWQFVCTVHNALGYSDEHLEFFIARGLSAGQSRPEEGELIEIFTLPLTELLEWVRVGRVTDVKTIIGAFWLEKYAATRWTLPSAG
ncbi:MAG: NUDIX hydrolase [Oxalobacter sp.]|nr:MAG: NUDIX hydrolase [Oxalobacter sp.]